MLPISSSLLSFANGFPVSHALGRAGWGLRNETEEASDGYLLFRAVAGRCVGRNVGKTPIVRCDRFGSLPVTTIETLCRIAFDRHKEVKRLRKVNSKNQPLSHAQ